jgi:hypothetical protein
MARQIIQEVEQVLGDLPEDKLASFDRDYDRVDWLKRIDTGSEPI